MATVEPTKPPISPTTTTGMDADPSPSGKIRGLLSTWEKRVLDSAGAPADIARLAVSPRGAAFRKKAVSPKPSEMIQQDGFFDTEEKKKKSTRQIMEDLSVFVSPREIKKKFDVTPKQLSRSTPSKEAKETSMEVAIPTSIKSTSHKVSPLPLEQETTTTTTTTTTTPVSTPKKEITKIGSIRDRMKAFEQKCDHATSDGQAPWMSQSFRGKRGSVLDRFTPKPTAAREKVVSRRNEKGAETPEKELPSIPKIGFPGQDNTDEETTAVSIAPSQEPTEKEPQEKDASPKEQASVSKSVEEQSAPMPFVQDMPNEDELTTRTSSLLPEGVNKEETASSIPTGGKNEELDRHDQLEEVVSDVKLAEREEEDEEATTRPSDEIPSSPPNTKNGGKIDRDTLVLEEIRKMIRDTEDNELEDDMDEEVKEILEKAAIESPAYTKRWYDALTDSWIHCPSLATIIMDFSLIEAAEELYGEELPMLYTVSLRAVAADVMMGEEELPEYVYRLAV